MGTAPIWLKKDEAIYMLLDVSYFIPKELGKPEEFELITGHSKPKKQSPART